MPGEHSAAVDRHLQPLVRIERDRIGTRDCLELPRIRRVERRPGTEGAVNVKPDAEFTRDVGDRIQRIDGAGIGRAAAGDDRKWQVSPPSRRPRSSGGSASGRIRNSASAGILRKKFVPRPSCSTHFWIDEWLSALV
jgi:hypothetical protein